MARTVEETAAVVGDTFVKVDALNAKVDALIALVEKLKATGGLTPEQQAVVDQMFDTATAEAASVVAEDDKVSKSLA